MQRRNIPPRFTRGVKKRANHPLLKNRRGVAQLSHLDLAESTTISLVTPSLSKGRLCPELDTGWFVTQYRVAGEKKAAPDLPDAA